MNALAPAGAFFLLFGRAAGLSATISPADPDQSISGQSFRIWEIILEVRITII
jgi:hypothetical protein